MPGLCLPDSSYLAEISSDGVTVTVRVIEYVRLRGRAGRAADVLPGHRPDGYQRVPQHLPPRRPGGTASRTTEAVITLANKPAV